MMGEEPLDALVVDRRSPGVQDDVGEEEAEANRQRCHDREREDGAAQVRSYGMALAPERPNQPWRISVEHRHRHECLNGHADSDFSRGNEEHALAVSLFRRAEMC
jgi:hypothetical protein